MAGRLALKMDNLHALRLAAFDKNKSINICKFDRNGDTMRDLVLGPCYEGDGDH